MSTDLVKSDLLANCRAELTRFRERNAELEREGASKVLSTREAVRVLRDAWRASGRRAEEVATENPLTNEQWRAYGAMEEAYAHANELDPEKDAMFEPCELSAAQSRIASLEATVREMRKAIAALLATPEIADADPRDKDEETQIAERKARTAIASSESVVKSEGQS